MVNVNRPTEAERAEYERIKNTHVDWHAKCRLCGAELTGTLKSIKEHVCGPRK